MNPVNVCKIALLYWKHPFVSSHMLSPSNLNLFFFPSDFSFPYAIHASGMEEPAVSPFGFYILNIGKVSIRAQLLAASLTKDLSRLPDHDISFLLVCHFVSSRILRIRAFNDSITQFWTSSFFCKACMTSSSRVPLVTKWWMITFSCCPCRCSLLFAWVYNS